MYVLHAKVLDGLEAGGYLPSELKNLKKTRRSLV